MHLLEPIGSWTSFMMEPLEGRVMLSVTVPVMDDVPIVRDAGGGRVVVADRTADLSCVMLFRLSADGSPDSRFGRGGLIRIPGPWIVNDLIVLDDGKMLVLAGGGDPYKDVYGAAIYRLNADGAIDPTFGDDGRVTLPSSSWMPWSSRMIVQDDGRIVVADVRVGDAADYHAFPERDHSDLAVSRYAPDGRPDATFGNQGVIVTRVPACWNVTAIDVVPADGEITVAVSPNDADVVIARYHADGSPVTPFGRGGVVTLDLADSTFWNVTPGGERFLAYADAGGALQQFRLDGELDASFGDRGASAIAGVDWYGTEYDPFAVSPTRLILGMPTPVGETAGGQQLIALRPDGSIDRGFGIDGRLILRDDPGTLAGEMGLSLAADGGLLEAHMAGPARWQPYTRLVVSRLDANGAPISTFGDGGRVVMEMIDTDVITYTPEPPADAAVPNEDPDSAGPPTVFASAPAFPDIAGADETDSLLLGLTPERSLLGQLEDDVLLL